MATFRPGDAVSCWIGTRICLGIVVAVDAVAHEPYTIRDEEGDSTWEAAEVFPFGATEADVRTAQEALRAEQRREAAARQATWDAEFTRLKARALAGETVSFLHLLGGRR